MPHARSVRQASAINPSRLRRAFLARIFVLVLACSAPAHTSAQGQVASPAAEAEARGDAAFAARATTRATDGSLDPGNINQAIAAYEAACAAEPRSLRLHAKLIEALYFKGYYVVSTPAERKLIYARSVALSEESMAILATEAGVADLSDRPVAEQAKLLKDFAGAAEAHFWAGINWGLWGLTFGNLASAREGVAARIRDHATLVMLLDPAYADGGGCRLLGRLHTVAPHIPFITGWVDRARGIELLEQAHATSQRDPRNALFLAEALLKFAPDRRGEAIKLLREAAAHVPDPAYQVEQAEIVNTAAERLRRETEEEDGKRS